VVVLAADYDAMTYLPPRHLTEPGPKTATAVIQVDYEGFSPEAQEAFQYAVDIWSSLISSSVVIKVQATWEELDPGVLGSAGSPFVYSNFPNAPNPNTWYHSALADSLAGDDVGIGPDIVASFSSVRDDWYLGTDGNTPAGQYDLVSVVLHELGHGLGFSGSATITPFTQAGTVGMEGMPMVYDDFVEDAAGENLTDNRTYPNPSTELGEALTSGFLFWGGSRAVSVNDGERPRLYAPRVWLQGSSYSHLDEDEYPPGDPNVLMTPAIGAAEANHDPGPITMCLMQDIGWTTAQDCGDLNAPQITHWVATASRASGAGGSQWRTRLGLLNRSLIDTTVEIIMHKADSMPSTTVTLAPGEQFVTDDVVGLLGASGSGSLEIKSSELIAVASRTFNASDEGTFGQYLDGTLPIFGVAEGTRVWLTLLEETSAFRTNIGFTNIGSMPAEVEVVLHDSAGTEIDTFTVAIEAGLNSQENQPFLNRGGRDDVTGGYASVRVLSGGGVIVYGSVIDNMTNDPVTIPMQR